MNRKNIERALLEDGIMPNLKGFYYLVDAIEMYQPTMDFVKVLYKKVADKNGTSWQNVERGIRHAITKSRTRRGTKNSQYIPLMKMEL